MKSNTNEINTNNKEQLNINFEYNSNSIIVNIEIIKDNIKFSNNEKIYSNNNSNNAIYNTINITLRVLLIAIL
jgi:hypothetical protein